MHSPTRGRLVTASCRRESPAYTDRRWMEACRWIPVYKEVLEYGCEDAFRQNVYGIDQGADVTGVKSLCSTEMTSVLRRYAQIDPRSAYFLTMESSFATWFVDGSGSGSVSSLMSITEFDAYADDTNGSIDGVDDAIPPYSLLKDLGRQITVYDSAQVGYPHVAVLRQVLYINQPASPAREVMEDNVIFYVCTWAQVNNGNPFRTSSVVRTG